MAPITAELEEAAQMASQSASDPPPPEISAEAERQVREFRIRMAAQLAVYEGGEIPEEY